MKEEVTLGQTTFILVGTGHVFQESVDLVRTTILDTGPDYVALELDSNRLRALQSESRESPGFFQIMGMGLRMAIVGSLLSYLQNKVGQETGVFPGAEMLEAAEAAHAVGASVVLIDQDIVATLNRLISSFSLKDIVRILFYLLTPTKMELGHIDSVMVDSLTEELRRVSPSAHRVLIQERDRIMARNLLSLSGTVVVVVGAGHLRGIKHNLIENYKSSQNEEMQ
ncbi:MAG: TraB/GumN family protein [Theionarchaea archaeon]|nr:TraB/GumN family protein [Theionarchaea archaeon]MBU6999284.1 TraB/GumN family protein [Theionarchaea archaeon]MBU7019591.1 TraB/GumN family protein [Theionarchaea archaeon]MBU7033770.1 TraB/GumN family protein [Theionarchaea archaeon]MBU7039420.1 TraB/GumN family protein [Theionarchaea archaeon]